MAMTRIAAKQSVLARAFRAAKFALTFSLFAFLSGITPANAQTFLIYGNGEPGDRMVVFANLGIRDRTPLDAMFGPERIQQVEIDIIFESPDKPDWSEMTLQFSCKPEPSYSQLGGQSKKKKSVAARTSTPDVPARFMIMSGSEYTRTKTYNTIAAEGWAPVSSELFEQVRKFTCSQFGIYDSMRIEREGGGVNETRWRTSLARFGLQDIVYVGNETYGHALSDLTWTKLWTNGKRPLSKGTGRQLTAAELAERDKKFAEYEAQAAGISKDAAAFAQPQIDDMNAQSAFAKEAASIRGNRKLNKIEASAIMVWQGKREHDVAVAMGPGAITDMEGMRFITYRTEIEVPVSTMVVGPEGQTGQVGGQHASCDVRFTLAYDPKGTLRVADVMVKRWSNERSYGTYICDDAVKAPRP